MQEKLKRRLSRIGERRPMWFHKSWFHIISNPLVHGPRLTAHGPRHQAHSLILTRSKEMDYLRNFFSFGRDSHQDNRKNGKDGIPQVATTPTITSSSSVLADNPFNKYGLSSPPQGENPQTLPRCEKLIKKDGFGKYLKAHNSNKSDTHTNGKKIKARCLVFLYGRGFYVHAKKERRVEKIESILNKPSAIERLVRLLESEGADRDITESREGLYLRHCQTLRRYFQQEGSFGFLPNQNEDADYFFRIQRQGNCFMHAACVIIPYLLQSRNVEGGYPVDLSKFVRHAFTDKELYAYIVVDAGGKGVDVLAKMLGSLLSDKPAITTYSSHLVNSKDYDLEEHMEKFGPGLVTGFDCNRHFENEDYENNKDQIGYLRFQGKRHHSRGKFVDIFARPGDLLGDENYKQSVEITLDKYKSSHQANDRVHPIPKDLFPTSSDANSGSVDKRSSKGDDKGHAKEDSHAMILIGGRREKGKLWLLLQNWWDGMQLVEVDSEYFAGCHASLSFVTHPKEDFAGVDLEMFYTMNSSLVADSNNLDRADYAMSDGCFAGPDVDRKKRYCETIPCPTNRRKAEILVGG